ncbi:MAG: hypothetical protein LC659_08995 [Myxococcales bacterium]|nr:hypothetical protein [Myxococcales bacterium]
MRIGGVLVVVVALAASARAQELSDEGDSYCGFVAGVARSESALLLSPQLFVDYGWVNGNDVLSAGTMGASTLPATQRLTAGLRYSFSGLLQGISARQRARAECERYRAASALARFVVDNRENVSPAALDAKLLVLRGAGERARQIVATTRAAVERARATVEELNAAELRTAELTAAIGDAEALRAGLPARSRLPAPETLIERGVAATAEVERYEARLRWARGFDVALRGGYDQVFGIRNDLPLFAVVSLTFNPAMFYQRTANAEAGAARLRWMRSETEGVVDKAQRLAARLRALLCAERRRLAETTLLVGDVEARLRAVEAIGGERLLRVRDAMWFDWVRLEADREFLRVHVTELAAVVGDGAP